MKRLVEIGPVRVRANSARDDADRGTTRHSLKLPLVTFHLSRLRDSTRLSSPSTQHMIQAIAENDKSQRALTPILYAFAPREPPVHQEVGGMLCRTMYLYVVW
jgi:hypothetical protein